MLRELVDVIVRLLYNLCSIMASGRSAQRLEEGKYQPYVQKGQEIGPREVQASQPDLSHWEGDKTANPRKHFQAHEVKDNHQE